MEPRTALLKAGFDAAHMILLTVIGDLDQETASFRIPRSNVPPLMAVIAHSLYGEDLMVNERARGAESVLIAGGFRAVTGITSPGPSMTPEWLASDFKLDGLRAYANAVFAATDTFISSATSEQLDRLVVSPIGTDVSVGELLIAFSLVHLPVHTGEISTLKGAQMLKGLPF